MTLARPVTRTATSAIKNAAITPAATSARLATSRLPAPTGLEQRVDEGCAGREFGQRDQRAYQKQGCDQRDEPEFLALARKAPQVSQQVQHRSPLSIRDGPAGRPTSPSTSFPQGKGRSL